MIQPFTTEPIRRIGDDGTPIGDATPQHSPDALRALWRDMLRAREFDKKLVTLLRQGRTTFYAQASGMEATQVGIARGMRAKHDWIWPYYRDQGIGLALGIPIRDLVSQCLGSNNDLNKGRQMPHHFGDARFNFMSISSSIANQVAPAAGTAMAQKYLGTDEITICTFGDGATSEGDWHAGMNMAAVNGAPCLFICENNQWAISVPVHAQTASENIHIKARAYGMPGYYVDGNDVIAVQEVVQHVADRVRRGEGPALIECLTYRVGSHSNADADAEKFYRTRDEVEAWTSRDPIRRFEAYLDHLGQGIEADERAQLIQDTHAEIEAAVREADASGFPDWRIMFDDVYSDTPTHLRDQFELVRAEQEA
ncbi:thiamine pyrophosphate-dependent dehydrogenase E1 component subunit alpha [Deinococcus maricopensis]|uniref:2-oxoisovalerate dehydrogenase subunit alpha n=1 Tax=Deinococcus maricopensis (strain DSM 21211 / LMG 22137 / NRRL B-23946 / LB-34) TaxID=709986 RepID=E8U519_DEIML|nr:thiamine pyrophosphate-dependent dehydrogenase E1 component subunit alpha [Deinococcus maricopensis]ADV66158.1 3-methyl-2-oxobutanoate dehydrogenase (2-methylpropanoyl-transferring) [Deinococcus maricopensis DSM 21211]